MKRYSFVMTAQGPDMAQEDEGDWVLYRDFAQRDNLALREAREDNGVLRMNLDNEKAKIEVLEESEANAQMNLATMTKERDELFKKVCDQQAMLEFVFESDKEYRDLIDSIWLTTQIKNRKIETLQKDMDLIAEKIISTVALKPQAPQEHLTIWQEVKRSRR